MGVTSVTQLIQRKPPLWVDSMAVYPYTSAQEAKFTTQSRFGDPIKMAFKSGEYLMVPRAVCPLSDDRREPGDKVAFDKCTWKPRDDQQAWFVKECLSHLVDDTSHIARAYTGFGKTACAMPVIAGIGRKTLVVVPKSDLIVRWREDLIKILGLSPAGIGIIQQDKCQVEGAKVVIGSLKSLSIPGRYPKALRDQFGLVIFDEVHRLGADTFQVVSAMFNSKLRWGLSATVERKDGKDIVFQANIGPILVKTSEVTLKPKILIYQSGWICPRRKGKDGVVRVIPHSGGKDTHVKQMLAKDPTRNQMIIKMIGSAYANGRSTVVFSDFRDHLDVLRIAAARAKMVKLSDTGLYVSGMKAWELDKSLAKSVIFATYGMMAEGTNAPWLDTLIFATPRVNIEQPAGRILREYDDKKPPVIFDVVDLDSPVFKGYYKKRMRWYAKVQAKVVPMKF